MVVIVSIWLSMDACHILKFGDRCIDIDNIIKKPFSGRNYDVKLEIASTASKKIHATVSIF